MMIIFSTEPLALCKDPIGTASQPVSGEFLRLYQDTLVGDGIAPADEAGNIGPWPGILLLLPERQGKAILPADGMVVPEIPQDAPALMAPSSPDPTPETILPMTLPTKETPEVMQKVVSLSGEPLPEEVSRVPAADNSEMTLEAETAAEIWTDDRLVIGLADKGPIVEMGNPDKADEITENPLSETAGDQFKRLRPESAKAMPPPTLEVITAAFTPRGMQQAMGISAETSGGKGNISLNAASIRPRTTAWAESDARTFRDSTDSLPLASDSDTFPPVHKEMRTGAVTASRTHAPGQAQAESGMPISNRMQPIEAPQEADSVESFARVPSEGVEAGWRPTIASVDVYQAIPVSSATFRGKANRGPMRESGAEHRPQMARVDVSEINVASREFAIESIDLKPKTQHTLGEGYLNAGDIPGVQVLGENGLRPKPASEEAGLEPVRSREAVMVPDAGNTASPKMQAGAHQVVKVLDKPVSKPQKDATLSGGEPTGAQSLRQPEAGPPDQISRQPEVIMRETAIRPLTQLVRKPVGASISFQIGGLSFREATGSRGVVAPDNSAVCMETVEWSENIPPTGRGLGTEVRRNATPPVVEDMRPSDSQSSNAEASVNRSLIMRPFSEGDSLRRIINEPVEAHPDWQASAISDPRSVEGEGSLETVRTQAFMTSRQTVIAEESQPASREIQPVAQRTRNVSLPQGREAIQTGIRMADFAVSRTVAGEMLSRRAFQMESRLIEFGQSSETPAVIGRRQEFRPAQSAEVWKSRPAAHVQAGRSEGEKGSPEPIMKTASLPIIQEGSQAARPQQSPLLGGWDANALLRAAEKPESDAAPATGEASAKEAIGKGVQPEGKAKAASFDPAIPEGILTGTARQARGAKGDFGGDIPRAGVDRNALLGQIAEKLIALPKDGARQEIVLRLSPEHLGEIRLTVQAERGELWLRFDTAHSGVKEILEASQPYLRNMLAERSIALGGIQVSVQQQGFGQRQSWSQLKPGRQGTFWSGPEESIAATAVQQTAFSQQAIDYTV